MHCLFKSIYFQFEKNANQEIETESKGFDNENPFTSRRFTDDTELKFDDGQSLFVSKIFLAYASPVFERMFHSNFKESETNCVELKGKEYDVFLEMLLFLHPRLQTPYSGMFRFKYAYKVQPKSI